MLKLLLGKIFAPGILAALLVGAGAGVFGTMKLQKPVVIPAYECPDCNCPEPTVSVQPFDVDKIKGLREFNYAPQFTGSIQVAGVDSAALRKMIDRSMDQVFQKYMNQLQVQSGKKRGRRTSNRSTDAFIEADSAFLRTTLTHPFWIHEAATKAAEETDKQFAKAMEQLIHIE